MNPKLQLNKLKTLVKGGNLKEITYALAPLRNTDVRDELNKVGPGMCLAKWMQVTLHLGTGQTHSCHHPSPHHIPLEEIKIDVSALHNTNWKKEQRKLMLEGGRPAECNYCWKVEDSAPPGVKVYSDRTLKSLAPWAWLNKDAVMAAGATENINPSYLEVSFSNVCNFKCSYCSPQISSKWMEEIKQHGAYPTSQQFNNIEWLQQQNAMPIPEKDENPYTDAFWAWWPDVYPTLYTFRITGGEPLLSKHTMKVLDYIIANPNPKMELAINSNCVVPDVLFDEFIEKIKLIQESGAVRSFTLYTSCEAHGSRAEYIRHGLDYAKWLENSAKFLAQVPTAYFCIMSTYNAFSVTSYTDFLKDVRQLMLDYNNNSRVIYIDIPYLNYPDWMSVRILPELFRNEIKDQIEYMRANTSNGFQLAEIEKLERIQYLFQDSPDPALLKDFVAFCDEHDRRRGTDFLKTFPEFTNFYKKCKNLE